MGLLKSPLAKHPIFYRAVHSQYSLHFALATASKEEGEKLLAKHGAVTPLEVHL